MAELLEHDGVALGGREHHLDVLGGGLQPLEHLRIGARVVAVLLEVRLRHPLGDEVVDVVAAEERVAGGSEDLEDVAVQIEQRAVERAAAEVVDGDALIAGATEAVGERGRGRLVEDAQDLETGDATGDLGRRTLQLVEVRRDGDDRALDGAAQRGLCDLARALEHERADLGQRIVLSPRANERSLTGALLQLEREPRFRLRDLGAPPRAADEALVAVDGVARVDDAARFRGRTDQHFTIRVEAHDAREQAKAMLVGEDVDLTRTYAGDDRVGRTEIDPDDAHA